MQHGGTVESTRTVLRRILRMRPTIIQIQTEMRIDGLSLIETAVGSGLSKEIEEKLATCKKKRARFREMRRVNMGNQDAGEMRSVIKGNQDAGESSMVLDELLKWEREHAELKKGLNYKRGQQS